MKVRVTGATRATKARKCLLSALGSEFSRLRSTGQRGTPRAHPTTARPTITVTTDRAGVVSHVGSRLPGGLANRTGLTAAFSDALAGFGNAARATTQDES